MQLPRPQPHSATVLSSAHLDGKVQTAIFQVEDPKNFTFLAGQYCSFIIPLRQNTLSTVGMNGEEDPAKLEERSGVGGSGGMKSEDFIDTAIRRTYSIILPPNTEGKLGVCVDMTPAGAGSKWLMGLQPGQRIDFLGPLGRFVLDKESGRKKVFVATGTGISAIRSMILDLLDNSQFDNLQLILYWGLRYEEDIFWKEEFEGLARLHQHFQFNLLLSRPGDTWGGRRGRVTDFVVQEEKNLSDSEFYLCGNRQMISDMTAQLLENNVPKEQIKTELFY